ncbi:MAG: GGDEF domain-containing protein, partial [Hungatella sp.]
HDYGDKVICAVASKLRTFFRKEDMIARMGGDEFAIFMEDISDTLVAKKKVDRLCAGLSDIQIDGAHTDITCSVGIAVTSEQIHTFEKLYKCADQALYHAKCNGRNMSSIYGEDLTD